MDMKAIFGGNPVSVIIRLLLISLVVGVVLSALGVDLSNFFYEINRIIRNLWDLGIKSLDWILQYILLGALVVIPIWLIARMVSAAKGKQE